MTEEELREEIAKWLHSHTVKIRQEQMPWLEETPWDDLIKEYRIDIQRSWLEKADEILALIKQNYVRLAKDQSLPRAGPYTVSVAHQVRKAREDMLKANFRKIEREDL